MKVKFLYLLVFSLVVITVAESIGMRRIALGGKVTIALLPLMFAVIMTMILGIRSLRKGFLAKIYSEENIHFAAKNLIYLMLPLMAYFGANIAPQIKNILSVGWVFLLQEIGNLGTVVLGLPMALMIGLRREAIGATLGIGREGELAYISEKYTLDSDEGRGVLSLYLIGTIFGAVFYSVFSPLLLYAGFRIEALAMAAGVGSASMMTGASSALIEYRPEMKETILAYSSTSQLLTSMLGTFTMVFLAVPLQRLMYKLLVRGDR